MTEGEAMMMTTDMRSASALRRWAMHCGAAADNPRVSGNERDRLLAMRKALLELAEAQDWLDGRNRGESSEGPKIISKLDREFHRTRE